MSISSSFQMQHLNNFKAPVTPVQRSTCFPDTPLSVQSKWLSHLYKEAPVSLILHYLFSQNGCLTCTNEHLFPWYSTICSVKMSVSHVQMSTCFPDTPLSVQSKWLSDLYKWAPVSLILHYLFSQNSCLTCTNEHLFPWYSTICSVKIAVLPVQMSTCFLDTPLAIQSK